MVMAHTREVSSWGGPLGNRQPTPSPVLKTDRWSCLLENWEPLSLFHTELFVGVPGFIYSWENKRSHLQNPVSVDLNPSGNPKPLHHLASPEIRLIQPSGKKGHCRTWANSLVTFSPCHTFSFSVISVYLGTWIRNSYPYFKFPPLRERIRNTDTSVSRNCQTGTGKGPEFLPPKFGGCIPGL